VVESAPILVPSSEEWPRLFEVEQAALAQTLAPWLQGGIHHVGSTAVPGLAAKPIIDIIAGVRSLERARAAFKPLARLGYLYHEHRPEAHAFAKPGRGGWWEQTRHLHLTQPGSAIWRERLAFRDALRADRALAEEYERWKRVHATSVGHERPYSVSKNPFVSRVLAELGLEVEPDDVRLVAARRTGCSG
jgi:GrpB-like predicted nucleotidyltransferase (UPF0157 family)